MNRLRSYPNPHGEAAMLAALHEKNPKFADAVSSLVGQLRAQGALVAVTSTVRRRERGYLMWGAYYLSSAKSDANLAWRIARLEQRNREWGLNIPIRWRHPKGLEATRQAARQMAEAYGVVFATEHGARHSNHYDGDALDVVARRLPASLVLRAPDGTERRFDLSAPAESRDLNLSPELAAWIGEHFGLRKLAPDYPHWDDMGQGLVNDL